MKKTKTESKTKTVGTRKGQINLRAPAHLKEMIEVGAKAAGLTQADFIERCVNLNAEAVADMTDRERAELRAKFKKLQEDAKLKE